MTLPSGPRDACLEIVALVQRHPRLITPFLLHPNGNLWWQLEVPSHGDLLVEEAIAALPSLATPNIADIRGQHIAFQSSDGLHEARRLHAPLLAQH